MFVRGLRCRRPNVRLTSGGHLCTRRPLGDSAWATVEAGPVYRPVVYDHSFVDVRIVNHSGVHVHYRGVVREASTAPFSTHEPGAVVSESVVHAAIEADMRTPIPRMEHLRA